MLVLCSIAQGVQLTQYVAGLIVFVVHFAPSGSGSSHASLPTSQLSTSQKRGGTPPPDGYFVRGVPQGGHNVPIPTHTTSGEPSSSGMSDTDV